VHPPILEAKRAFCKVDETRDPYPYLIRNKHIIMATQLLLACPQVGVEITRSGTWATIRLARRLGAETIFIPPFVTGEFDRDFRDDG
jgi:hypothetical protein